MFFAWLSGTSAACAHRSIRRKTQVGPRRISGAPGSVPASLPPIQGSAHKPPSPWLSETIMLCLALPLGRKSAAVGLASSALLPGTVVLCSLLSSLKPLLFVVFVQLWWELLLHGQNTWAALRPPLFKESSRWGCLCSSGGLCRSRISKGLASFQEGFLEEAARARSGRSGARTRVAGGRPAPAPHAAGGARRQRPAVGGAGGGLRPELRGQSRRGCGSREPDGQVGR